jgi:hypothetical protein
MKPRWIPWLAAAAIALLPGAARADSLSAGVDLILRALVSFGIMLLTAALFAVAMRKVVPTRERPMYWRMLGVALVVAVVGAVGFPPFVGIPWAMALTLASGEGGQRLALALGAGAYLLLFAIVGFPLAHALAKSGRRLGASVAMAAALVAGAVAAQPLCTGIGK